MAWLTEERRLALFPAGTIAGDPHNCKSTTCHEQYLNLRKPFVEQNCAIVQWFKTVRKSEHNYRHCKFMD